jgi:hypothetical protein
MVKATDSTPAVVDDKVYICGGCSPWASGYEYNGVGVYCFDTDGTPIWQNESDWNELIMGSWTCSPAVADGMVFVGDPSNAYDDMFEFNGTYALDAATGDVIWYLPYGGASPAVADGTVFTIGGGRVYAVGDEIPAGVRIEPETLNLNASGVFTAFITLPECYDVADINVSTVECEGAPALNGTIAAADNGTLVVKFARADLRDDLPVGDAVEMTVTGELIDGTKFEGSDMVRVIA